MEQYLLLGVIFNYFINLFLIVAVSRQSPRQIMRSLLGAAVGACYAAACMVPRLSFLQSKLWLGASLLLCCMVAFGVSRRALRRSAVFCLLRLALEGLASGAGVGWDVVWSVVLCAVCRIAFAGSYTRYLPVELRRGGNKIRCRALVDTGNRLQDPITGRSVLVVDAQVAEELTGLTRSQLADPLHTMGSVPGLRLIPYHAVGGAGFLLAMWLPQAQIGTWQGGTLVAFSPEILDQTGAYQALIGGAA